MYFYFLDTVHACNTFTWKQTNVLILTIRCLILHQFRREIVTLKFFVFFFVDNICISVASADSKLCSLYSFSEEFFNSFPRLINWVLKSKKHKEVRFVFLLQMCSQTNFFRIKIFKIPSG